MKPHLPNKLYAALLAAVASVCFTLQQSWAAPVVITLGEINTNTAHDFVTDDFVLNAVGDTTYDLSDGSTLAMTRSGGKFWGTHNNGDGVLTGTWTNTAALAEWNNIINGSFTAADLSAGDNYCYTASGNGGSTSTATLSLDSSLYTAGSSIITIYVTATAKSGSLNDFTVSGLDDCVLSYATNNGNGFVDTPAYSNGASAITLIKATGTLNGSDIAMHSSTGKNGWQSISYTIGAPEPPPTPPAPYTTVIITAESQLSSYTSSDYTAFLIGADIADSSFRMNGAHQYWTDYAHRTHSLTFEELGGSTNGGALNVAAELVVENLKDLNFIQDFATTSSKSYGGAICVEEGSSISISDNLSVMFSENHACSYGGAIYAGQGSNVSFTGNDAVTFIGNYLSSSSSLCSGGAICASSITLTDNKYVLFRENSSDYSGGAISMLDNGSIILSSNDRVEFCDNNTKANGSAIFVGDGGSLSMKDNGRVVFSGNSAADGAICVWGISSSVVLSDNDIVEFIDNHASRWGGAFDNMGTIIIERNGSVKFSGNYVFSSTFWTNGGAIDANGSSSVVLSDNGIVEFSRNYVSSSADDVHGGVIDGSGGAKFSLTDNESVAFIGNYALSTSSNNSYAYGGAIVGGVDMTRNENVTFSENFAMSSSYEAAGGAIYGGVNITGVSCVTFGKNYASSGRFAYGGAICDKVSNDVTFSNNDSVLFVDNYTSSSYCAYGGAIYAKTNSKISIEGNNSVVFRGNYEKTMSEGTASYRLRSVYVSKGSLKLSVGEGQNITFYDTLYASSDATLSLNAQYADKDGVMQDATGDIVFSGAHAEADLRKLKPTYTQQELTDSLTTEVNTTTNLYGGRLRVEDGAVYKGHGINVVGNSAATLRLVGGTLDQAGYNVTLASGTTLDLQGKNSIKASQLKMQNDSTIIFSLENSNLYHDVMTLDGIFNQVGNLSIIISADETFDPEGCYMLMSMTSGEAPKAWDASKITLSGIDTDVNRLKWEKGVLYYNYRTLPPLLTATWSGALNREWNFSTKNWTQAGYNYLYEDGVDVVFQNAGRGAVELVGELKPKSVLVENDTGNDYTFIGEGKLAGDMQLTKDGTGSLTIETTNTYTGGTILNMGTLVVGNSKAFGSGVIYLNGGTLDLGGFTIANDIMAENADGILRNGFFRGTFSHTGGSLVADSVRFATTLLTIANAGDVSFRNTISSSKGGAIYATGDYINVSLAKNEAVTFSGNSVSSSSTSSSSYSYGGAIYVSGDINFMGNQAVTFSGNSASSTSASSLSLSYSYGGAIYADGTSNVSFMENGAVTFSGNYVMSGESSYGGAIFADDSSNVSFTKNEVVTFSENYASSGTSSIWGGGAIVATGTVSFTENGTVMFNRNYADEGGAFNVGSGTVSFTGNAVVTFNENFSTFSGGAIEVSGGTVSCAENGIVTFSGNFASNGGAISVRYGSTVSFSGNEAVTFSGNFADFGGGGAIEIGDSSIVSFSENEVVTFSGNSGYTGCAVDASYSTVSFTENGTVTYSGNSGYSGGAVSGSIATIIFMGNETVTFSGNYASSTYGYEDFDDIDVYGGAILAFDSCDISFSGNEAVTFIGNYASSAKASAYGGAICDYFAGNTISIEGNGSVIFRSNYEKTGGDETATYRLRSVYMIGSTLKLAAGEGQNITFYDTLYASSDATLSLNAQYQDKDGVMKDASGDIVFSGKYAEEDLRKLKPNYTQQELTNSLTTEVYTTTNLYSGRLRIEDGAVYKGNGISVAVNSGATLRLVNGTLDQAGCNVALAAGTTLDLQGVNCITAHALDMQAGSSLSFAVCGENLTKPVLTLMGTLVQGGALSLQLSGDDSIVPGQEYALLQMADSLVPETWDWTQISVSGMSVEQSVLNWNNGVLYLTAPFPKLLTATWSGGQSRAWNTVDMNWTQDEYSYHYKDGIDVVFGDTGSGEVILEGNLAPASVLVNNSTNCDYSFVGDGKLTADMQLTKEGDGTLTIGTANDYTGGTVINGGVVVVDNATALGSGDVALNGAELDIATDATISGQITVDGDNYLIVEDGCILSLGNRIANNYYLEMWGTYDISNLSAEVLESEYIGGAVKGNGFFREGIQVQVVDGAFGAYTEMGEAFFLYNGFEGVAGLDGEVMVTSVDYSRFFVFSGVEYLGKALDAASAAGEELEGITMSAGTTLHVDRDMSADFVSVANGSVKLDIKGSSTVTEGATPHSEYILIGSGVYALASGNTALAPTLDSEGWTGTVALKDIVMNNPDFLDLDNYGHEGSTVSLDGVKANFGANGNTFATTMELTGDGLEITACQAGKSYEFAGGVKGDGNFIYNLTTPASNQTYIFSGDVSDWTGAYVCAANKTSTLQFQDDATVMGADIIREQGVVNVVVGDGSEEHTTVFKSDVQVSNLTVQENATAVIEGAAVIEKTANRTGILSLQGTLEVAEGGSLALSQDAAVQVGEAFTVTGKGSTAPALSGNLEISEAGFHGTGEKAARIDHSVVKLSEGASVVFDNVILGATSRLTDDPATVVANNLVIEGILGENVQEGDPLTIKSGSIMQRLGQPSELIELDSDASACKLDITNVDNVSITGNCLTIDLSGMYPALMDYSQKYDWLGISLGSGDQVATLDTNMVVELKLNDRLHPRAYYMRSVGWGGTDFDMPQHGENVGMIYICMFDVPEPATSTMSLLALAALAARRRRK